MTHLIHSKLERKKKRKNASCKHVFLGAKFQTAFGLPSSHSQKTQNNTVLFSFSLLPAQPVPPVLPFHFAPSVPIGNCVFGIFFFKHGSFLAVCLRISLLPPPKKKKVEGFSPKFSWHFLEEKKNTYHPLHPKNQAVCCRFAFFWGGTLSLSHGGCPTTWICEATILFCRVESSVGGSSQSHRTRWEKGNAWMSRWKLDVKG